MSVSVLYLLHQFSFGGTERVVANILNHSSKNIKNYVGSFYPYENAFLDNVNTSKATVFSLDKQEGNDFSIPCKIESFCKKNHIDIIHSMGWSTYAEGLIAAKAMGKKQKFIYSYRGKTMEDTMQIPKRRIFAQRLFSSFCDAVLTNSGISRKEYASDIGIDPKKINVIYNGVDINLFGPHRPASTVNKRDSFKIKESDIVIGSVARFDPVKGIKNLVKVFSLLSPDVRKHCKLLLVGDGSEKKGIQALLSQLGMQDQVILTGMRKDIPDCLRVMDIYVQPSLFENISNSVLEAMATGLPVISTNVGGIREILDHNRNGLIIELGNENSMAEALDSLIKNAEQRKIMGKIAREKVADSFSIQKMVSDYEVLYQKLLSKR